MLTLRATSPLISPALAGMLYFGAAVLALLTSRFDNGLAFIWLANAFLMAELLTARRATWWRTVMASALASAVATALFGMGPAAALPMVVANMAESLILAIGYRRFIRRPTPGGTLKPLLVFILLLCGVATPLSGLVAGATTHFVSGTGFWNGWLQWYAGHVLGGLIGTPMLAMALRGDLRRWWRTTPSPLKLEGAITLLLFAGLVGYIFFVARYPLMFLPLLGLVLIAFRHGSVGSAAAILLLALIGGTATMTGHGPINQFAVPIGMRVQFFQLYVAACFLVAMPMSAELNGRGELVRLLRESEARYRLMADSSGDMMLNLSPAGLVQYASPLVEQYLGVTPDALMGQRATLLAMPDDRQVMRAALQDALGNPGLTHRVEFRPANAAAAVEWCEMVMRAIVDDRGEAVGLVCSIRDMSAHKAHQRTLLKAAFIDQLTAAASRRAFLGQLDLTIAQVARDRAACVALIDIDHFKRINDRYGHAAGDEVLRAFVARLRDEMRGIDLIGRLGGEEFGLLLPDCDLMSASTICERLRIAIAGMAVPLPDGSSIGITFSAGLVEIERGATGAAALEAADKALYAAKHSGRNCLRLAA
jgi:diguanylate cyclase (GGDEF)-like protein/PAS domain S-box-containing protein